MDCNRFEGDLLVAYLFGETTEEERKAAEEHLGSCERCARVLSELGGTVSTMRAWKDEELPRRVVLLAGRRGRDRLRPPFWMKAAGWAAAAALALLIFSQGSIQYRDGSLTVSFGPDRGTELKAGLEEGRSTETPTEVAHFTSDSSSSTPRRTGLLHQSQSPYDYATMSDLETARRRNMVFIEQLLRERERSRAEEWRQDIDYVLAAVNEQRRRDLNELLTRIDAVGAGALDGIQMTNIRLDELAGSAARGTEAQRRSRPLTPEQIRRMQREEEK